MFSLQRGDDLPTDKAAGLNMEGLGPDIAPHLATGADFDLPGADAADDDPLHDGTLGRDVGTYQSFLVDEDSVGNVDVAFKDATDVYRLIRVHSSYHPFSPGSVGNLVPIELEPIYVIVSWLCGSVNQYLLNLHFESALSLQSQKIHPARG